MMKSKEDNETIELKDIPHLLALAAEHDRVDILQDLIQRAKDYCNERNKDDYNSRNDNHAKKRNVSSSTAVPKSGELTTNDKILNYPFFSNFSSTSSNLQQEEEKSKQKRPDPFIPPLHIAISSGSVHASTCLLRMGADPSIRPQIGIFLRNGEEVKEVQVEEKEKTVQVKEEEYDGEDEGSDAEEEEEEYEEYSDDEYETDEDEEYEEYSDEGEYETDEEYSEEGEYEDEANAVNATKQSVKHVDVEEDDVEFFVPEEWNFFRKYHNYTAYELLYRSNLPKVKLSGIEHAFFAEALRSIGSEDANRLQCLLQSGMKAGNEPETNETKNNKKGSHPGEKTLFDWALDMNEDDPESSKCVTLLKNWGHVQPQSRPEQQPQDSQNGSESSQKTSEPPTKQEIQRPSQNLPQKPTQSPSTIRIMTLKRKIEESHSLASSLTPILEDLMQETKLSQTLILGPSPDSNGVSPLVAHVRTMKASKAQKEVELRQYQGLWQGAYLEEQRLNIVFKREYSILADEKKKEVDEKLTQALYMIQKPFNRVFRAEDLELLEDTEKEDKIVSLAAELAECESKVRTLRASLVDMTEENSRVLEDVKKLGLTGPVRLARKLRQELVECERNAKEAKEQADICQDQVNEWILKIKCMRGEDITKLTEEEEDDEDNYVVVEEPDLDEESYESDYDSGDGEESTSSGEYEEYSDDEEEDDNEVKPSAKVASGMSEAIVVREKARINFWDLIRRIVGLGKKAVKETTKNTVEIGRRTRGVMVI